MLQVAFQFETTDNCRERLGLGSRTLSNRTEYSQENLSLARFSWRRSRPTYQMNDLQPSVWLGFGTGSDHRRFSKCRIGSKTSFASASSWAKWRAFSGGPQRTVRSSI